MKIRIENEIGYIELETNFIDTKGMKGFIHILNHAVEAIQEHEEAPIKET